ISLVPSVEPSSTTTMSKSASAARISRITEAIAPASLYAGTTATRWTPSSLSRSNVDVARPVTTGSATLEQATASRLTSRNDLHARQPRRRTTRLHLHRVRRSQGLLNRRLSGPPAVVFGDLGRSTRALRHEIDIAIGRVLDT